MAERVLVVGGGGREHAIARAVAGSDRRVTLFACAGNRNPGIADLTAGYEVLDPTNVDAVRDYARRVDAPWP